jgi:hypothetical protein
MSAFYPARAQEKAVLQHSFCDPSWWMSTPDSLRSPRCPAKIRTDGWTAERQLRFLEALASTRSVAKAAAFAGMSRESAYRLRSRRDGALFAALWDRALAPDPDAAEVHDQPLTNGRIMRLLGNHYRRQRGDFLDIGGRGAEPRGT